MTELDDIPVEPEWKFNTKDKVHYSDPDEGISSGEYMIIERIELSPDEGYNLYLLSNGRYNIEAYEKNLSV
jgi:hypothetical protein